MKIQKIEVSFPCTVSLPDGFQQTLNALVGMVCEQYQRENPTRVMWPAGHGSKIRWSQRDAAFLGKPAEDGANDSGEPEWDDSVYAIEVSEREDLHGNNPHNPDVTELRQKAHDEWQKHHAKASAS